MFKWLFGGKSDTAGGDQGSAEIVVVSRTVNATPSEAFAAFVDRLSAWWPRDLTWAGDNLDTIAIDPKINGKATEKSRDGSLAVWGTVLSVQRPDHIVIAWQIAPNRQPESSEATSSASTSASSRARRAAPRSWSSIATSPATADDWRPYRATLGARPAGRASSTSTPNPSAADGTPLPNPSPSSRRKPGSIAPPAPPQQGGFRLSPE
ncbi:MAG: hypothetical protein WDM84_08435 [Bauldia sp.]